MTNSTNRSALQEYYGAFDCAPGAAATADSWTAAGACC